MFFHWSQRYSKSPQISRTPLSSLADLNNADVWMISARPLISTLFQAFGERSKRANNNWCHRHSYVPQLSRFSRKVLVLLSLFGFLGPL